MQTSDDGLRVYDNGQLVVDFADPRCTYAYADAVPPSGAPLEATERALTVTAAGEQRVLECDGDDMACALLAFCDGGAAPRRARMRVMELLHHAAGARRAQLMRVYNNLHALAAFGVRVGWLA